MTRRGSAVTAFFLQKFERGAEVGIASHGVDGELGGGGGEGGDGGGDGDPGEQAFAVGVVLQGGGVVVGDRFPGLTGGFAGGEAGEGAGAGGDEGPMRAVEFHAGG